MKKFLFFISILLVACEGSYKRNKTIPTKAQSVAISNKASSRVVESFADSLNVGNKRINKVEITRYVAGDSNFVVIRFYSKANKIWQLRTEFRSSIDGITGCDPQISDFNNDGKKDLTYISAIAARGSNGVRALFIYNSTQDKLILIKNSQDFPNIRYNSELNCLDAMLFYGCHSTVFMKLEADSLRQFASVEQCDSLTVTEFNKKGAAKVLRKTKGNSDDFIRYTNYNPLRAD